MQKTKQTRFLSLLLVVVMIIGLIPINAFAAEIKDVQETTTEVSTEPSKESAGIEETTETVDFIDAEGTDNPTGSENTTKEPENGMDVDYMTDAELLAYYAGLSDEEVDSFALTLTEVQLNRLSELLTGVELCSESSETHTVFKNSQSTLAPGVTQNIKYAYAADGKQMVYYIATADVTRDDVVVQSSYLKQYENKELGMSKLTEQAAYANQKYTNKEDPLYISDYYNVVAGVNSSFYNMQTGQPMGITFIDGISFGTKDYDNFFAILKDGKTAVIDYAKNLDSYVDENGESTIWQAAAGSEWLVRDGKDVTAGATGSYNTDRHSRTCVGITADGKVVLMVLDGRQEPFSCGGSMHELAQIMLEAGCVVAVNLDGGGSTTFASKPEGENAFRVVNNPSDGSERSISAGIIVASTTVPSDAFDHVAIVAADEYVTPGTSTEIAVSGVSPAGSAAEIPADVTYTVANGTYEDGILTANETGEVVLTAMYNGEAVGSVTVHAVIPEKIAFPAETISVPYGKSLELEIKATHGLNEVKTKASDFTLQLHNPSAGTLEGMNFTACQESSGIASSKLTAYYFGYGEISATTTIAFGKESEVLWDFEDGDISDWRRCNKANYNYIFTPGTTELSSKVDGGIVHSGDYALKFNMDFSVSTEGGFLSGQLGLNNKEVIDLGGAVSFGMWMYVPIEAKALNGRIYLRQVTERNADGTIKSYNKSNNATDATMDGTSDWNVGFVNQFEESGWHYISFDLTNNGELGYCIPEDGVLLDIYVNDRDNTTYNYNHLEHSSLNQNVVMYIDDVTLDYSSVVEDREFPIFSGVTYADTTMSDAATLNKGATISGGTISFTAKVAENTKKNNASGLDASTAKAYVDGKETVCTFDGSKITIADIALVNGSHTVKFSICDKQGNYASTIRNFTVRANGNDGATILLKPHNTELDKILLGSVYYVDIVATKAEAVQNVVVDLDLNNISRWELDHMEVANGFEASYEILDKDENIARVTITGSTDKTGKLTLVSMPIRTWELPCLLCDGGTGKKGQYATYELFKKGSETWPIDVSVTVIAGILNSKTTFAGDKVQVDTESYVWDNATKPAEYATWNGGHDHRPETKALYSAGSTNHVDAVPMEDKAATCTEKGYTGRTYCKKCESVVDWGTTQKATGHSYEFMDGVLKCHCDETFSGTWTDGRKYVDGVVKADGWSGDSYYVDGMKLIGLQLIDGCYYDFGEDGVCIGQAKYTGFLKKDDGWYYIAIGTEAKGWQYIDGNYYYFDPDTGVSWYGKPYYIYDQTYLFNEKGMVMNGIWHNDGTGTLYYYGPGAYTRAWVEIGGNTYYFDEVGHRKEGICWFYLGQTNNPPTWYEFTDEGVYVRTFDKTGLWEYDGKLYYLVNGVNQKGLVLVDDSYYYFNSTDFTAVSGRYYVNTTNGLDIVPGYYNFDESTHKMVVETDDKSDVKNGLIEENGSLYYYVDGVQTYAGLIQVGGDYYYINSSCKAVTGTYWVFKTNGLLPEGSYEFGADGKMIIASAGGDEVKNGLVEENGALYYYVDGVLIYAGLIQLDGNYYYINSSCKVVTGTYWVFKTNDLLPAGFYEFGADGKMIIASAGGDEVKNGLVEESGTLYYYVDGAKTYAGLIQVDGDYYYINSSCKAVTGTYWVFKTNGLLPEGSYEFGADGKMIIASAGGDEVKNGLIEENGALYYYIDGAKTYAGLVKIDGDYYYINSSCKAVTGIYWVFKTNDLLPAGNYTFGTDGKMITE